MIDVLATAIAFILLVGCAVLALGAGLSRLARGPGQHHGRGSGAAIDRTQPGARVRPNIWGGTGLAVDAAGGSNTRLDDIVKRSQAYSQSLTTAAPRAQRVSANQSAQRLVYGIAGLHDVTLFLSGPLDPNPDDPGTLLHDILITLGLTVRLVDVSSDTDMHLGLPQTEHGADLPHLFIGGQPVGNHADVLHDLSNGSLLASLSDAKIAYDSDAARALTQ